MAQRCVLPVSFPIYYYGSNKAIEKEIDKTHLCAWIWKKNIFLWDTLYRERQSECFHINSSLTKLTNNFIVYLGLTLHTGDIWYYIQGIYNLHGWKVSLNLEKYTLDS